MGSHPAQSVLWRVLASGRERHGVRAGWWWDNPGRRPAGIVVVQYIAAGQMLLRIGKDWHEVGPGQAGIFVHGEDSSYGMNPRRPEPIRTEFVVLDGAGLLAHYLALREMAGPVIALPVDLLEAMRRLASMSTPGPEAQPIAIADAVQGFTSRLWREGRRSTEANQPPVQRAVDELLHQPAAVASLKALAARHRVSREHLTRVFIERVGVSPSQHLAAARLNRARELLAATDLPMTAVAQQAGYPSAHNMARQFRAQLGMSPSEARAGAGG